jgi:tRNA A-37 threonylcarbamoyl transferase component Bud32
MCLNSSLNGNPITKFEIARNDLQRFQSLEVFEASVDQSTCERSIAEKILVKGITLCVLDDKDFDVLYGKRAGGQMSSDDFSGSKSSFNWNIPVIIFAVIVVTVGAIFWGKNMLKSHNAKSKQQMPPALQGNYNHNNNTPSNDPSYALMSSSNVQMESLRRRNSGEDSLFGTLISSMMDSTFLKHRIPINDIQLQKVLAKGGNGIIYLAKHNRRLVVVKKILPEKAHEDSSLKSFLDEVRMCANLNHPKIVTFLGVSCTTIADVSVVIEYMPNGDLDMLLKRHHPSKGTNSSHEFDWFSRSPVLPSKVAIAVDVIEAVVYLHSFNNPIIHRDLKAKNVLLDDRYNAKLSDFGVSREFNMDATMTGGIGTVAWIAPEVLRGERYSEKADIYSYGVILSEMSTHEKPFDGVTNALVVLKVTSGEGRPCIAPDTPDKIRNLADRCLSFDPEERPSGMIVHHELRTLLKSQSSAVFI